MTQLADDLRAAKALIDTPEKWGKGDGLRGPSKPKRCAIHAVAHGVDLGREDAMVDALTAALPEGWQGGLLPIAEYNDDPSTTHADVLALFDRAIATAESAS